MYCGVACRLLLVTELARLFLSMNAKMHSDLVVTYHDFHKGKIKYDKDKMRKLPSVFLLVKLLKNAPNKKEKQKRKKRKRKRREV